MRAAGPLITGILILFLALTAVPQRSAEANVFGSLKADKVLVVKGERRLYLLHQGMVMRVYRIELGRNPMGTKVMEGDGRTPEGWYVLDTRNENSRFHRSIRISYPNEADLERARMLGVAPGGAIMIHGQPSEPPVALVRYGRRDWTEGCIAVSNSDMDEIWSAVEDGTPIEILP